MQVFQSSLYGISFRQLVLVLTALIAVCLFAMPVMAHSPTNMVFSVDPGSGKLLVTITHPVDNPTTHYVDGVQVLVNGNVVSDPQYNSQPTKDTFTYTYDVTARPGDRIRVIATCVLGGLSDKTYEIPVPEGATTMVTPSPQSTPASQGMPVQSQTQKTPLGFVPLFGAAIAILLIRKK